MTKNKTILATDRNGGYAGRIDPVDGNFPYEASWKEDGSRRLVPVATLEFAKRILIESTDVANFEYM